MKYIFNFNMFFIFHKKVLSSSVTFFVTTLI